MYNVRGERAPRLIFLIPPITSLIFGVDVWLSRIMFYSRRALDNDQNICTSLVVISATK